jgi:raffinose/stachyose/melibiose transport system permease protein
VLNLNSKKIYPQYLVILPLLVFFIFLILPSISSFYFAFTDWNPFLSKISFTGFGNFVDIFKGKVISVAAVNTISFTIITAFFKNALGLIVAIILNRELRTKNILRAVYFVPVIFSALVVGLIFVAIFDTNSGIVNVVITHFWGADAAPEWLGNRILGNIAINITEIWRSTGYAIVIFLAGLQAIPQEYYEAAEADGANAWQKFKNITLPMLIAPINLNVLLSILYGLKIFDIVYIMTRGGPGYQTETFSTLILNQFAQNRYAKSVATNLVFSIFLVIVALVFQKYTSKLEVDL